MGLRIPFGLWRSRLDTLTRCPTESLTPGLRCAAMTTTDELHSLLTIAVHAPNLTGARCKGRQSLWEMSNYRGHDDRSYAKRKAVRECSLCRALPECAQWLATLSQQQRPTGAVCAGVYLPTPAELRKQPPPRKRPRPRARPRDTRV